MSCYVKALHVFYYHSSQIKTHLETKAVKLSGLLPLIYSDYVKIPQEVYTTLYI